MRHSSDTPAAPVKKRSPLPLILIAVFVIALGVILVPRFLGGSDAGAPAPVADSEADPMATAAQNCDTKKTGFVILSEENRKLIVKGAGGASTPGLDETAMKCVFTTLGVPGALSSRMLATTAEDGRLTGEWPGYTASWSNDANKGLDFTVLRTE